jgi:hypothetical protein
MREKNKLTLYMFYKTMDLPENGDLPQISITEDDEPSNLSVSYFQTNPYIYIHIYINTIYSYLKTILYDTYPPELQRSIMFHLWPPPLVAAIAGCHDRPLVTCRAAKALTCYTIAMIDHLRRITIIFHAYHKFWPILQRNVLEDEIIHISIFIYLILLLLLYLMCV